MTWVKICGTTNLEDALTAVDAGADALGFVFYEKSPRKITPEAAREIVAQLPPHVEKVGVFVEEPFERALDIFNYAGLTAFQLHLRFEGHSSSGQGKAFDAGCFSRPPKMYIALPAAWFLEDEDRLKGLTADFVSFAGNKRSDSGDERPPRPCDAFFLDSGTPHQPGGTGKVFDWEKAAPLVESMSKSVKVVIAGGLNPTNVGEAIRILHPWGVDVASGVEARPGKKDPEKVRAFVAAVRQAEKKA